MEEREESDAGSGSERVSAVSGSTDSGCSQRGCPEKRHRFRQKEIFRGNPAVAPAGGVTLPGITDDDETVDIVEIPAGVADIGVGNLELTVHITLFPGGIAEKQTVQCAGTATNA